MDVLQPSLTAIERVVSELNDSHLEPSGLIRINSSRIAARLLLEPHMGEFLARHPKLRLELVMADGFSNIIADGMDAGIRLGESLDEHVVAVPITPPLTMAIVGSPDYFRQHGTPQTPGDLTRHNCLAYRFTSSNTIDRWSFTSPDEEQHTQIVDPKGNAVFNDDDSMLRAALQGVGLALFLPFDGLVPLYVISAMFGLFQGGIVPAYAIIIREYFAPQEAGARVGAVIMATLIGMALGGWMSGWIFDLTGSYRAAFLNGMAWNLLNLSIVGWLFWRMRQQRAVTARPQHSAG